MKKLLSLIIVSVFLCTGLNAQPWLQNIPQDKYESGQVSLQDLRTAFDEYWKDKEVTKGSGFKQYMRHDYFVGQRIDETDPNATLRSDLLWKAIQERRNTQHPDNSANWEPLGPFVTPVYITSSSERRGMGRINAIAFHPTDPDKLYVGAASGGFWRTSDGGETWETTTDDLYSIGVSDIVLNPDNPDEIYLVTGDSHGAGSIGPASYTIGILKSTDGGATWNETGLSIAMSQGKVIRSLLINPDDTDVQIAASSTGIYRTTDGWSTYSIAQSGHFKDLEFKPGDPNTVYAGQYNSYGSARVYRSTDGGANWTQISSISGSINRIELAVTEADPDVVYAVASKSGSSALHGVYKSTNSGQSFTMEHGASPNLLDWYDGTSSSGQAWYDLAIAASPTNANEVYVGGVNIWKSTNGGDNFSKISHWFYDYGYEYVHADQHVFKFSPSGDLYIGCDGGFYRTSNGGTTYDDLSDGLTILQIYRFGTSTLDPTLLITGSQDNGSMRLLDGEWKAVLGGDGMDCMVSHANANHLYASQYNGSLNRSLNQGMSFVDISPANNGAWVTPMAMNPDDANIIYAAYGAVYKSEDRGSSWTPISTNYGGGVTYKTLALAVAPSDPNYIYYSADNSIWRTTNGGESWEIAISGLPPQNDITYIAVSNDNPERVWVTKSGFLDNAKIYMSEDAGGSWVNYSDGLPNVPANCAVHQANSNNLVYVGTDLGVYYRDASMNEWELYSEGLPNVIVSDLEINYTAEKLRAATYGRGVWESDLMYTLYAAFETETPAILPGESVDFTNLSTGFPTSFEWTFEGGDPATYSGETPPAVTYATAGDYDVTLEVSDGTSSFVTTIEDYISVVDVDFEASITQVNAGSSVDFTDLSSDNAVNWSWEFPGGDPETSTDQNPTGIVYDAGGEYDVTLTVNGTASVTKTAYLNVVGVQDISDESGISVFPNPSNGELSLNLGTLSAENVNIKVYDELGNLVKTSYNISSENEVHFDFTDLSSGIYLIKVEQGDESYIRKVSITQ